MPIYVYQPKGRKRNCPYCQKGFELLQKMSDKPLVRCPRCQAPVEKQIAAFSSGFSRSTFDQKAKEKGMHKLKRVDKGKYEKLY